MKINRIVFTWALALFCTFAVIPAANLHAQTNADIAKNAFAVTVPININNFVYTPVTIPAGKRLVVQDVSLSGAAQTAGSYVQPIIILGATLGSGALNLHYYAPIEDVKVPGQFYSDFQTTVYADTLEVGPAFSGFDPTFMSFSVVITGYLVELPK